MENEQLNLLLEQIENTKREQCFLAGRLLSGEKRIRGMNVYYAAFAAVAAVLSLIYPESSFSQLSAVLTVLLSMMVIALSAQKYAQQARHHHVSAHAMQQLLLEAQEECSEGDKYRVLREKYGVLTASFSGIGSHEYRAVLRMHDTENRRRVLRGEEVLRTHYLCGYEKFKYWLAEIMSIILGGIVLAAPIAGMVLAAAGLI